MLDAITDHILTLGAKSLWLLLLAVTLQVARKLLLTENSVLTQFESWTSRSLARTLYVLAVLGAIIIIAL